MARTKSYSDTMIRAMLSALTHQGSDGRYQILTRGSTLAALEVRGAVEMEETTDNHGRPVGHWHLTPAAVRNLRNGLVLMMGGSTSNATAMHREFVRSGWREAEAAARLILGDFEGAKLVTSTRHEGRPHVVELGPADTIAQLANILSNGQPVHEHGTGPDGDEPAERLSAHLGGAVGAVTDFYIKRPAVEVEQVMYARHTGAHGFGWARRVCEDNAASVRAALALARREGRAITVEDGGVIRVERAGMVDPGHDGAGDFCPVWFVPQRPAAVEEDGRAECDECGETIPDTADSMANPHHAPSCSLYEEPPAKDLGTVQPEAAAPGPRPAAEVLAADPIPADTPVWDGMPGEAVGSHGVRAADALTDDEYVIQLRSERVWTLPNHDDGAHMSRTDVLSALARVRSNAPTAYRASVDADGTVYVSDGRQAARYLPVRLFADYSADFCPGCSTPYAVNGDGPCSGGRSPLAPGSRDYDAEAAELLGDGERWVRHWYSKGTLSAVNGMDRREALGTVVLGLKRGEVRPADDGERGVRVVFEGGESAYWLEPVTVQPQEPEEQHDRAADDFEREAAELLGEGAQWLRHWRRGEDAAVIPVDREGALNIIVQALRAGDWTTGRRDGGATLVSPTGESSYWLQPVPPAEDAPELSDVWQVKDNDGEVVGHVRAEFSAEAKRAADKLLGRPEGKGGGYFLRRLTVAQEEARQAEAEETVKAAPKSELVPVCDLSPGDAFVTRCAWTVLAADGWTFTAVSNEGQTVTQTVKEGTQVRRTRRATNAAEGDVFAG